MCARGVTLIAAAAFCAAGVLTVDATTYTLSAAGDTWVEGPSEFAAAVLLLSGLSPPCDGHTYLFDEHVSRCTAMMHAKSISQVNCHWAARRGDG
jgi:hypothetical protein